MNLGIVGIVNFNEWDNADYNETGGINSVIKTIIPHLTADKMFLYGITDNKDNLLIEKKVAPKISIFPLVKASDKSLFPRRVAALLQGWRIGRYLKKHQIDFIYCHNEEFGLWIIPTGIPYIFHLHTYVNVLEVSGRRLARLKLLHSAWNWMRTRVIKHSYKIIAANKDITALGERLIGKDRIIEFPNFVDIKKFVYRNPAQLRKQYGLSNRKVVLFTGRISMVKGMELFVDSVEEVNRQSSDCWLGIIVGNGEYERSIRNYIQDRHLGESFLFIGSINNKDELCKYYSLANVFLITSFSEIVPLTLLESLCCGTPVVSTDVGICKEVLQNNNGFVVDSRKPEQFAKAILRAADLKLTSSLLPDSFRYSVEYASGLLNKELSRHVA